MDKSRGEEISELEKVLASRLVSRAPNLASILGYICREHLAGRGAEIKEYNIAVKALGRGQTFDPARDSIVRVEFSRLRKRLQQYYETEGSPNPLRIELSEVGYVPRFVRNGRHGGAITDLKSRGTVPVGADAPVRQTRAARNRVVFFALAIGLTVCIVFAGKHLLSGVPDPQAASAPSRHSEPAPAPSISAAPLSEIRIRAGSPGNGFRDNLGRMWESDRYFTGGVEVAFPDRRIARTLDPTLYRSAREGDFRYDIPLKPGVYELHLHFSEILPDESDSSSVQSARRFFVTINGKPLLSDFDIAVDAPGNNAADERVFKDISPAEDGLLHLRFMSFVGKALLSGIEIFPVVAGRTRPVRILTGSRTHYDRQENFWGADRYFSGGHLWARHVPLAKTLDSDLYASERSGNFQYFIPVADGRYAVTLRFAESNFGVRDFGASRESPGGVGSRRFDIYCNGVAIARDLDIFKEAGGPNMALEKTFRGLKPNAQGKLVLSFVPLKDYASVRSIEVIDESR